MNSTRRKNLFFLTGIVGTVMLSLSIFTVGVHADYKYYYYDYTEMVTLLQDLETQAASKTPNVYSLQTIGYSYLGNPIYAVKFSDNPGTEEDSEPDIVIDPGLHGNEWLPMESNINFIQYLFDVYYNNLHADYAEVQYLVNNFEIWIIPMINVDGRIRDDLGGGDPENFWTDTTYHTGDADGWRMNVQEVNCPSMPGGTNQGIDINRSWSRRFWEDSNCAANYHGVAPLDPTESKVLKQFINNHMISLVFHQHSALNSIFSNSGTIGLGAYLTVEADSVYEEAGLLDPLLALTNEIEMGGPSKVLQFRAEQTGIDLATSSFLAGTCNGMFMTGQYFNWLWYEIDCTLSSDHQTKRGIQCLFGEYPTKAESYGYPGGCVDKIDDFVKSQKSCHSRETCPRPDRGTGVHNNLKSLDSCWSLSRT